MPEEETTEYVESPYGLIDWDAEEVEEQLLNKYASWPHGRR